MSAELRPAQPKSILRGHKAQVHAATFIRNNERLVTGDADGFITVWDLTIMRPRAVWQAHTNAILGIAGWGLDRIITHGRDNKLVVWRLGREDEARMSTTLPLDSTPEPRPQPWILHMLEVNTMNFCSFSHCPSLEDSESEPWGILVAVPNTLASEAIDIFHLPSQSRRYTVKLGGNNGMVMALSLFSPAPQCLALVAGYENGMAIVAQLNAAGSDTWEIRYQANSHSQPVLSLDVSPSRDFFLTSSADAIIAKHPLTLPCNPQTGTTTTAPPPQGQGQRGKEQGEPQHDLVLPNDTHTKPGIPKQGGPGVSLLAAALAAQDNSTSSEKKGTNDAIYTSSSPTMIQTEPLKIVNTKHAGQQSLRIRSDGRIFATAGWDSKVRVYSTKTLKELAVLKWHQVGCYATAFAEMLELERQDTASSESTSSTRGALISNGVGNNPSRNESGAVVTAAATSTPPKEEKSVVPIPKLVQMSVRDKRLSQAKTAHWLAAGSKDGKVSLWDIF